MVNPICSIKDLVSEKLRPINPNAGKYDSKNTLLDCVFIAPLGIL